MYYGIIGCREHSHDTQWRRIAKKYWGGLSSLSTAMLEVPLAPREVGFREPLPNPLGIWEPRKFPQCVWGESPAAGDFFAFVMQWKAFYDTKIREIGTYRSFAYELLWGSLVDEPQGQNIGGLQPWGPRTPRSRRLYMTVGCSVSRDVREMMYSPVAAASRITCVNWDAAEASMVMGQYHRFEIRWASL